MRAILFVLMILSAIVAIQTNTLRNAVIYLSAFSLITSFIYLIYKAPDVAIAEAIIGSTLSTILFLVALKKYKIFKVYFINTYDDDNKSSKAFCKNFISILKQFSIKEEIELDLVHTSKDINEIIEDKLYDLIIKQHNNKIFIYGNA